MSSEDDTVSKIKHSSTPPPVEPPGKEESVTSELVASVDTETHSWRPSSKSLDREFDNWVKFRGYLPWTVAIMWVLWMLTLGVVGTSGILKTPFQVPSEQGGSFSPFFVWMLLAGSFSTTAILLVMLHYSPLRQVKAEESTAPRSTKGDLREVVDGTVTLAVTIPKKK
jgi:hypothetical protein